LPASQTLQYAPRGIEQHIMYALYIEPLSYVHYISDVFISSGIQHEFLMLPNFDCFIVYVFSLEDYFWARFILDNFIYWPFSPFPHLTTQFITDNL
jgi:hypothetical protein